ncbi:MAG TPA: hypothetical protein VGD99_11240 [Anaerolineae bacterium]
MIRQFWHQIKEALGQGKLGGAYRVYDPNLLKQSADESPPDDEGVLVSPPSAAGCPIMMIFGAAFVVALLGILYVFLSTGSEGPTATPAPLLTEEAAAASETRTFTPQPSPVAIDEEIRLGEMAVERPFAMTEGGSASWLVEIYIPEQLASRKVPVDVEFVQVDLSEPPDEGALFSTDLVTLWLSRYMQVELRVPAGFSLNGPPAVWKEINLDAPQPYVVWEWLLTAPNQPGSHEILLNVYQARVAPDASGDTVVDTRQRAIPPRRYQIKVHPAASAATQAVTPTPVPPTVTPTQTSTATPTPTLTPSPVPFFDRPGTTAGVGALATIVAALIGLVGVMATKDRLPLLTKAQKRRSLERQLSEKTRRLNLLKERQSRHGINTDPAVLTEIEDLEGEIEQLEQELEALDTM